MTILSLIKSHVPATGQKYSQLENLFRQAIREGTLRPGEKLPPLRDAAWQAGCSLGTMSRVYAALERRGMVTAEVGRGTFVREETSIGADIILPRPAQNRSDVKLADLGVIDLAMNAIANEEGEDLLRWALHRTAEKASSLTLMTYRDGYGTAPQKLAMRAFLPASLQQIGEERLLINHGAQNGIFTALNRLTSPGDTICLEPLCYPGVSAALSQSGLSSVIVDCDDFGIDPIDFERLCRAGRLRLLVTTATGHNPTCITTPLERRQLIGEIAKKYDVLIIEDDIYGFLYPDAPPPYATLFPDNAIYLTGLAKRLTPSLRIGVSVASPQITMLMAQGITAQSWMVSPVLTVAASELALRSDSLQKMTDTSLVQARERERLTRAELEDKVVSLKFCHSHAWVELPDLCKVDLFIKQAELAGVLLTSGHRFSNRPGCGNRHVRLSIMAPGKTETLGVALRKIGAILSTPTLNTAEYF
ncbi:PLP-dependent aminotransferase family protein [Kiloniella laminariae]|uniref:aminotransferase-like domain-containing protein n=1 Tax=Kiloniella laminariae TaxID=454162 RepID=UPI000399CFCA|nr:PLP-dependent aminotransferase family protein [Kiloniella laminariae]